MTPMEKAHTSSYYFDHFLKLIPQIEPVSIAFFKGNLNLSRLKFIHKIIMHIAMILMKEIKEGEFINPDAVADWTENLYSNQFNF
ncbi:hypothetical protein H8E88_29330 [candidate division KSB1 bacterium]|nr:hypothetical protein [candidate division KSB1 bacterium]